MSKRIRETFTGEIVVSPSSGKPWVCFTDERGHDHLVCLRGDWEDGMKARITVEQIPARKEEKRK